MTSASIAANGNLSYNFNSYDDDGALTINMNFGVQGFAGWDWSTPDTSLNDTMLGQMMDPSQCPSCPHIFNGADSMVKLGTAVVAVEATAVATVAAAPVVVPVVRQGAAIVDAMNQDLIAAFAEDPGAWRGTLDVVQGFLRPTSPPTTPEGAIMRVAVLYWAGKSH